MSAGRAEIATGGEKEAERKSRNNLYFASLIHGYSVDSDFLQSSVAYLLCICFLPLLGAPDFYGIRPTSPRLPTMPFRRGFHALHCAELKSSPQFAAIPLPRTQAPERLHFVMLRNSLMVSPLAPFAAMGVYLSTCLKNVFRRAHKMS